MRAGNADLGPACRTAARPELWLLYALMRDADAAIRERILQVVHAIDDDRSRVSELLVQLVAEDQDAGVRKAAAELEGYVPGAGRTVL